MIKSNRGNVIIEGTITAITSDFICICKALRDDFSEEQSDEIIKKGIELSRLSTEEIRERAMEIIKEKDDPMGFLLDAISEAMRNVRSD